MACMVVHLTLQLLLSDTYIIYLLRCYYLAILYRLYYIETLTLLTLIVLYFTKFIDKTLDITIKSI
jgi:hypothetical protein